MQRTAQREGGGTAAGVVLEKLLRQMGTPEQGRLIRLWQNWTMVMGPDIAAMAWPLGQRNGMLLVGGEDAMALQELSMLRDEMLERANAFMDAPFFRGVTVTLSLGRTALDSLELPEPSRPVAERPPRPSGIFLKDMDPESPVARCYARFAARGSRDAEGHDKGLLP